MKKPLIAVVLLVTVGLSLGSLLLLLVPPGEGPTVAPPVATLPTVETPILDFSQGLLPPTGTPPPLVTSTYVKESPVETPKPPEILPEPTPPAATPAPTPEIVYLPDRVERPNPKEKSIAARLRQFGPAARRRMRPWFEKVDVAYPPAKLMLVGLKQERLLKVYAANPGRKASWRFVCQYPIAAAGASPGPKLRQGDRQTPEGLYRVVLLNPESMFHLSLRLNYPNSFDIRQAERDRRTKLGGDIMIHGFYTSDGCLAMGDTAATDLFVLVADTGARNTEVLLSPVDFRTNELPSQRKVPAWTAELYEDIRERLAKLDDGESTVAKVIRYRDAVPPESFSSLALTAAAAGQQAGSQAARSRWSLLPLLGFGNSAAAGQGGSVK